MKVTKCATLIAVFAFACVAQADVVIPTVPVGNLGNVSEMSGDIALTERMVGGVDYAYEMGSFEITAGQYTEFLNAVASTDTHSLWHPNMWMMSDGCKIRRSGAPGYHTFSVEPDFANRPVNFVSWADTARFANWMHNGQPVGAQDASSTEDGSYTLNGAGNGDIMSVLRNEDATWVIPSEDEWYKAAYHKNDGATANYFDYPTSSDIAPDSAIVDPDPGNNANVDIVLGSPYFRTEVGEYENSKSPYGAFDMAGNVWEWTEADVYGINVFKHVRGGSFWQGADYTHANYRHDVGPPNEVRTVGFRLAYVPEPASIVLMAVGCVVVLGRKRSN